MDEDEDQALLLLSSLPSEYNSLSDTFIYGRDSLSLDEVKAALFSKELKKKLEGGGYQDAEGLYTRGIMKKKDPKNKNGSRSKSRDGRKRRCFVCGNKEHLKKDCPDTRKKKQGNQKSQNGDADVAAERYDSTDIMCVSDVKIKPN